MDELERTLETTELVPEAHQEQLEKLLSLIRQMPAKATRTNKSFMGVLWSAWSDGVVAHWVELIALEVEAAISSFTDLGPPQTRFTRSCVCPYWPRVLAGSAKRFGDCAMRS